MNKVKGPVNYDRNNRSLLELKEVSEDGTFSGYAAIFGKADLDGEIIDVGAFSRTIKRHGNNFSLLWQHDPSTPIGKATVEEDSKGLKVTEGKLLLSVEPGARAYEYLKAKIISAMSIGFQVVKDLWDREDNTRHLKEINLWEVSLVSFPAQPLATIRSVKSLSGRALEIATGIEEDGDVNLDKLFFAASLVMTSDIIPDADEWENLKSYLGHLYRKTGRFPPWEPQVSLSEMKKHVIELEKAKTLFSQKGNQPNPSIKPFDWSTSMEGKPELDAFDSLLSSISSSTQEILRCLSTS